MTVPDAPAASGRRRQLVRWGQAVVLVGGVAGLVVTARVTLDDMDRRGVPGMGALAAATLLMVLSHALAGRAWVVLFEGHGDRRALRGAFYLSMLAKYVPAGGLLQAVSQVNLSRATGVPLRRTALLYPVFMAAVVAAGACVSTGLVFVTDAPVAARIVAAGAPLTVVCLDTRLLARALRYGHRLSPRIPAGDDLPGRAVCIKAFALAAVQFVAFSIAFAVLVRSLDSSVGLFAATAAFAASWTLGFLAIPVPSGLGVREAALILLLPGAPTGILLAASVAHRLVTFLAEVMIVATHWLAALGKRQRAGQRRRWAELEVQRS